MCRLLQRLRPRAAAALLGKNCALRRSDRILHTRQQKPPKPTLPRHQRPQRLARNDATEKFLHLILRLPVLHPRRPRPLVERTPVSPRQPVQRSKRRRVRRVLGRADERPRRQGKNAVVRLPCCRIMCVHLLKLLAVDTRHANQLARWMSEPGIAGLQRDQSTRFPRKVASTFMPLLPSTMTVLPGCAVRTIPARFKSSHGRMDAASHASAGVSPQSVA